MLIKVFVKFFSFICFGLLKPVQSHEDLVTVLELYCRVEFCFMEITLQLRCKGWLGKIPLLKFHIDCEVSRCFPYQQTLFMHE